MNKLFFSLSLLLATSVSFAQKNNFGIISYAVVPGYKLIKNDNVLTWYKEDKSTGAYCNFFIYKIMPGHGGTKNDFDFAWNNLVQNPFKFTASPAIQPEATLKGWKFLIGNSRYNDNGAATLVMLINFSGENNMQAICILSNSDRYKKDIEDFIASVDLVREAISITANNASAQTENNTTTIAVNKQSIPAADNGPKPEVWMKSRFEYDMMKKMSLTKYEWIAIYPDGKRTVIVAFPCAFG